MVQLEEKKEKRLDPRDFAFWLRGFFEMSGAKTLNEEQVKVLKEHLELIFEKVTPDHTITVTDTVTTPLHHSPFISITPPHPDNCNCSMCDLHLSTTGPTALIG